MKSSSLSTRLVFGLLLWFTATVTIFAQSAPVIYYGQPSSQTLYAGQEANYFASANGDPMPTYQWQRLPVGSSTWANLAEGGSYAGTNTYHLSIVLATMAMNGDQFRYVATNTVGSVNSFAASLTVSLAVSPQVNGLSSPVSMNYGESLELFPSISGSYPMTYQWKKDGVNVPGATNFYFSKAYALPADAGQYALTATNYAGTATSSAVTVTVNPAIAPAISGLPATMTLNYGDSVFLPPNITGTAPMTFQWKRNGVDLANGASQYYSRTLFTPADNGQYTLSATNLVGTVVSSTVTITVNPAVAPAISNLSPNVTVEYGETLSLNPMITGTQPITFQLKKDTVDIPFATSGNYLKGANAADSGQYTLTATNQVGSVTSTVVTVTVNPPVAPIVSLFPPVTAYRTNNLYLQPVVTGTQPISYQWKKDGENLLGKTGILYFKESVATADAGEYTVTATNFVGSASSIATVSVLPSDAPRVRITPASNTVNYGEVIYFTPWLGGASPMTYEWKKDGVLLADGTALFYSKQNATTEDSGQYTLTATNLSGTVTSTPVTISVAPAVAPTFTNLPATLAIDYGTWFELYPNIGGTQPMTYQWKKDGVAVADGTSGRFSKFGVTTADSGQYTITATNFVGTVTSLAVNVIISPPVAPTITEQPTPLSITQGFTANFNVIATGTYPIIYQWYFGGDPIPGATGAWLTVPNVQPANRGSYSVVVTNAGGSATSNAANLSISPPLGVTSAVAGDSSSFFIKSGGSLWGMGRNSTGEIGDGTTTNRPNPISIAPNVVSVTSRTNNTVFIKSDGSLWAMGPGGIGQNGIIIGRRIPVQIASGVVAAASGNSFSLFIKSDGTLWAMGDNSTVQIGGTAASGTSAQVQVTENVVFVSAGQQSSLFIKSDGTLWSVLSSFSDANALGIVPIASDVVSASAGEWHSLFVKADGSLWAFGENNFGQLGDGTNVARTNPVQVATGVVSATARMSTSLFLKADGTLWGMGLNHAGQLGNGVPFMQSTPGQIATGVVSASLGYSHSMFVKSDGSLWTMGYNESGQLGDGTYDSHSTPLRIASGPLPLPIAPVNLTARHVPQVQAVRLSWNPTVDATGYEVWRNTANDSTTATRIAPKVHFALFFDNSAQVGVPYYYWVKAVNPAGASGFSAVAPGTTIVPPSDAVITLTVE